MAKAKTTKKKTEPVEAETVQDQQPTAAEPVENSTET